MSATEQIIIIVSGVGTSWVVTTVPVKARRYKVYRARAVMVSGALTTIGLRILEGVSNIDSNIAVEYDMTPDYIDFEEPGWLVQTQANNTYIALKADAGVNTIKVVLDIEPM